MTTPIVALSVADTTVRAAIVCVLALIAMFVVGGRFDWSTLRPGSNGNRRPAPVYLRVDQRPAPEYRQPSIRRRAASSGQLAGFALVSGIVIAIAVSIVLATIVGSVTNLLR